MLCPLLKLHSQNKLIKISQAVAIICKLSFFILLFYLHPNVAAQVPIYSQQFSIVTENDCYASINNDGYYTNGIKLTYQKRKEPGNATEKTIINALELGQFIYNAQDGHYTLKKIDRPITAYLYVAYRRSSFNPKGHLLQWNAEAGAIGAPALGKEIQQSIHKFWQLYKPTQWEYQMQPGWGVNGSITYSPQIGRPRNTVALGFKPVVGVSLGNMFTHAMIGSSLLIGKFNGNKSSAFWSNHISYNKSGREFFFYLYPALYLQAYNATVQGNMFKKNEDIIKGKLNPLFFKGKAGITWARTKFSIGYTFVYENKQSLTQKSTQYYGSLQAAFRW